MVKAEHLAKGANPRYVVTSLSCEEADARTLYEDLYCARGDMENRIKEQQLELFADRTSTQSYEELYCARGDRENRIPDRGQGAATGAVCRVHQHAAHARQPAAAHPLHRRLYAAPSPCAASGCNTELERATPGNIRTRRLKGGRARARDRAPGRGGALRNLPRAGYLHAGCAQSRRASGARLPRLIMSPARGNHRGVGHRLHIQCRAPVLTGGFGLLLPTAGRDLEKCPSETYDADLVKPSQRTIPLLRGD